MITATIIFIAAMVYRIRGGMLNDLFGQKILGDTVVRIMWGVTIGGIVFYLGFPWWIAIACVLTAFLGLLVPHEWAMYPPWWQILFGNAAVYGARGLWIAMIPAALDHSMMWAVVPFLFCGVPFFWDFIWPKPVWPVVSHESWQGAMMAAGLLFAQQIGALT